MAIKFCWFWCMGVAGHKQLVLQLGGLTLDRVGLVIPAKARIMESPAYVCLSVCLFVCVLPR